MQEVSQTWKDVQRETLVPESFVEIILNIGDPDAQAADSAKDNGHVSWSDVGQVVDDTDKNPVRYATLERNIWLLDGTFSVTPAETFPNTDGYIGSALSGDDGTFEVIPTITITFSQVFQAVIPGVTITWASAYDEWATKFKVTVYNNDTELFSQTVENNNTLSSIVERNIQNYNKIVVEILEWCLPCRRARVENILIGVEKVYTKTEILNFSHNLFVDPLSAELPKSEIQFEVLNLDGKYNPDNPQGTEKYLMERQEITARYGYKLGDDIEWIKAGTFYMSEWETPQNGITATFTARDSLEYMSDTYSGPSSGTLLSIATAALTQAGLPPMSDGSPKWTIDGSLGSITAASGADLSRYSIAEVVQLCANAACCVFYQDRTGRLHIEKLAEGQTDYPIDRFVSYQNSEISLTKQLKAIDVNNGQYILSVGTVGETQDISNPLISASQAQVVARWAADFLLNRKILSGQYRADPRLDPLDRIVNSNQFAETVVLVTELQYTYNGAFRGNYEGRAGV